MSNDDIALFSKPTPGPWVVSKPDEALIYDTHAGRRVAVINMTRDGWTANARLIAAAPDLLQALEQMRDCAESCGWRNAEMQNAIDAIAAIAKAKGHS